MKDFHFLTAPCGIDCFNCEFYEENLTEELKDRVAAFRGIDPEQVVCRGCRDQKGCRLHFSACATLDCVKLKNVKFCFECGEFPCPKLQPASDGAARFPHNMKVYNLCRMKQIGVERWAIEESKDIRDRYFHGTFIVGLGPVVDSQEDLKKNAQI
ncbi:MAG TPA: DUF3795 domain-containing protein [Bacillota bacterium]|nr:DUF3795 domain-containing protein [Bacillota bacterium]